MKVYDKDQVFEQGFQYRKKMEEEKVSTGMERSRMTWGYDIPWMWQKIFKVAPSV